MTALVPLPVELRSRFARHLDLEPTPVGPGLQLLLPDLDIGPSWRRTWAVGSDAGFVRVEVVHDNGRLQAVLAAL